MNSKTPSPYLGNPNRLGDVIAAIQATGTYKFYRLRFKGWAKRISGDKSQASHWQAVFEDHPEFFRLDPKRQRASLVWRRQHQKRYDVDAEEPISKEKYKGLTKSERKRVSRIPLGTSEIEILIRTAIDLHSRALERKRERRWWVSTAAALAGAAIGAAAGVVGSAMKG